jgi:hypothetical protein
VLYADIFTASKMRGIQTDRVRAIQITRGFFDTTLNSGLFVPRPLHTHTQARARNFSTELANTRFKFNMSDYSYKR